MDSLLGIIPFLAREFPDDRLHVAGDGAKRDGPEGKTRTCNNGMMFSQSNVGRALSSFGRESHVSNSGLRVVKR